jgi:hypothetical protein
MLREQLRGKTIRKIAALPQLNFSEKGDPMQKASATDRRNPIHYEILITVDRVKVKVPRKTQDLEDNPGHPFAYAGRKMWVEDHYRISSYPFGPGIVQRNFFRFAESDLGKNKVATVKVTLKTTRSGKRILLLDIFKEEDGAVAQYELRFLKGNWEIEIPDSHDGGILFEPTKWFRQ